VRDTARAARQAHDPHDPRPPSLAIAKSTRYLTEHKVTHMVSVCIEEVPAQWRQSGIEHLRIPVEDVDAADILGWLPAAVQFIANARRAGGVVLVHSVLGQSRSAVVAAAYREPFLLNKS
jgi:dual specificity phosphatase 12